MNDLKCCFVLLVVDIVKVLEVFILNIKKYYLYWDLFKIIILSVVRVYEVGVY